MKNIIFLFFTVLAIAVTSCTGDQNPLPVPDAVVVSAAIQSDSFTAIEGTHTLLAVPEVAEVGYPSQVSTNLYASLSGISTDESTLEVEADETTDFDLKSFLLVNWIELLLGLMAFMKVIVNLTPTQKDNKIFGMADNFFNFFIPNLKKGGGTFSSSNPQLE